MIRRALSDVGRWIDGLISPAPQVQFGVAGAVDEQEAREVNEMMASFGFPSEFQVPVSAAADAVGTGPGAASTPTRVPAPGRPDRDDQVRAVRLLIEEHYISVLSADGHVACHCDRWEGPACGHADHIADVVDNMLSADVRMSAATNRFQQ